jgi:hypothetical protein
MIPGKNSEVITMNIMTVRYIDNLSNLKSGEISILRTMRHKDLDEDLDGFDLFTGIWWPLREKNQRAPQRETAWLIAKLYACYPLPQVNESFMPVLLGMLAQYNDVLAKQITKLNDTIVSTPVPMLELPLGQAIRKIQKKFTGLDWVSLTDTLSRWGYNKQREVWVQAFNSAKYSREVEK